jgi:transcriptional regulator with XRE-family HTH domain
MAVGSIEDRVAGALLLSARTELGLSQTAFAELLCIAQPTLSAYESGRRQPTLPTLLRLLSRAGFDLRMELTELDRHDEILAEWERSLDERQRSRLAAKGYRPVVGRRDRRAARRCAPVDRDTTAGRERARGYPV